MIEMPRAVNGYSRPSLRPPVYEKPAGVVAIRAEANSDSRVWRVLRGSIAAGILVCLAVIFVVRDAHLVTDFGSASSPSRLPHLSDRDDFDSVVQKLGFPASDRWIESRLGASGYRRLWYPRKGVTLILNGTSRNTAHYSGTLNRNGNIIHSADAGLIHELDRELDSAPVIH